MVPTLLGGGLSLVGVAIGGVAAHLFTARRERETREETRRVRARDLRREKGEELYALTAYWARNLLANCVPYLMVMKGGISFNNAMDVASKNLADKKLDFERIEMLIDVYFPAMAPLYESCIQARDRINAVFQEFARAVREGTSKLDSYVAPYLEAQDEFETAANLLKEEIREMLRWNAELRSDPRVP